MEYQVWTNKEYEGWAKVDCGDLQAAQRAILEAIKQGQEPLLTVAIPFEFTVKVKEDKAGDPLTTRSKKPVALVQVSEEVKSEAKES